MRKIFTVILICICSMAKSQTNIYHEFPDSAANWNITSTFYCLNQFSEDTRFSYYLKNDTIIGNVTYHQLWSSESILEIPWLCFGTPGTYVYPGYLAELIREDVTQRKVFVYRNGVEELLYDFNLQVGDTINGALNYDPALPDTVVAIDSILVGNSYRKRWSINPCYQIYIIEGIGCTYGLTRQSPGCMLDMENVEITCFSQDAAVIFPQGASSCEIVTGIKANAFNTSKIIISPNPSKGDFKISLNDKKIIKEIVVYDLYGNIVLRKENFNDEIISIKHLPAAAYFLNVTANDGFVSKSKMISID